MRIKDNIYKFIIFSLNNRIDECVFAATSLEDLGKAYFQIILSEVEDSTNEEIISVIDFIGQRFNFDVSSETKKYEVLCDFIGIRNLPKDTLDYVKSKYDEIFNIKYSEIQNLLNHALKDIDDEIQILENKITQIATTQYRIYEDISKDKNELIICHRRKNQLRTQKDVLESSFKYAEDKLNEYCQIDDSKAVYEKNKTFSIENVRDTDNKQNINIQFRIYEDFLEACRYIINDYNNLFYDIKIFPLKQLIDSETNFFKNDPEEFKKYENKNKVILAQRNVLINAKSNNDEEYLSKLQNFLSTHSILDKIKKYVSSIVCIANRRELLVKSLQTFESGEYEMFNAIIPVQIEGLFSDLKDDVEIYNKFESNVIHPSADLKKKIDSITDCIPFEYNLYYKNYFNNIIRNVVAHGRLIASQNEIKSQIFANELILDLFSLLYMISRNSEAEKMYRYIHKYIENIKRIISSPDAVFRTLYNDLTEQRTFIDYDSVNHYPARKILMWIVNPCYEKLYIEKAEPSDTSLKEIRDIIYDKKFWEYFKAEIEKTINNRMMFKIKNLSQLKSIICSFKLCDIPEETKIVIIETIKILQQLENE